MRLSLGSALLLAETNGIDVLLLDEPTNHLDLEGLLFLEHLLSRDSKESGISSVIVVSHDEDFLRSVRIHSSIHTRTYTHTHIRTNSFVQM